jgi:amidophosphoribosyltransferase
MCGIIGLVYADKASHVNQALIDGLTILQHRGQDASGIVTSCNNRLHLVKNNGRVADVFTQENIVQAIGNIGVGHVRYPTSGGSNSCEAQPMYTNFPFGIAIAHNGNLTNTDELAADLRRNFRHVNTDSDSEVLLNVFAEELFQQKLTSVTPDNVFSAVGAVMNKCKGAFAVVILINGVGLLAFRDPHGIRPLCFGQRETPQGMYRARCFHDFRPTTLCYVLFCNLTMSRI